MFEKIRPYLRWFFNNPHCEFLSIVFILCLSLFFFRGLLFGSTGLTPIHIIGFALILAFSLYLTYFKKS